MGMGLKRGISGRWLVLWAGCWRQSHPSIQVWSNLPRCPFPTGLCMEAPGFQAGSWK